MKIQLQNFYKELTLEYLSDRLAELSDFEIKLQEGDIDFFYKTFHKLAGSGGSYGLTPLSELASKIEEAAENNQLTEIQSLFKQYKNLIETIELDFQD